MKQVTLSEKLKTYSAVAGAMTLAATSADAQIVYTDVNPDFIVHDSIGFTLDFDGNSVPELNFGIVDTTITSYSLQATIAGAQIVGSPNNAILGSIYNSYPFPFALNTGDTIRPTGAWNAQYVGYGLNVLGAYINNLGAFGNWLGATDRYLGVQFNINNALHYGWVRLAVSQTSDTIIVKDYAYNVNDSLYIVAGSITGINENNANGIDLRVHAYDQTLFVHTRQAGARIEVLNAIGQTVTVSQTTDTDTRMDLSALPTGVYLVRVEQEGFVQTKKIYLR
jgi:hypothetical protein